MSRDAALGAEPDDTNAHWGADDNPDTAAWLTVHVVGALILRAKSFYGPDVWGRAGLITYALNTSPVSDAYLRIVER